VKLMVCKDSKQNEQEMLGNKNFYKNAKTNNFSTRKTSFLFKFSKISCRKTSRNFAQSASYLYSKCTAKTYEKDFFLATDATTQSSNQEENETREFFFFLIAK
jgi:hypothetical protein